MIINHYNRFDKESIIQHARGLLNRSIGDFLDESERNVLTGKGRLGQLVEAKYFKYKVNSSTNADFHEVGMELKCSPLKVGKNGFVSKERLVLNIINYLDVVDEKFDKSSFMKKNADLLLMFYLHEKDKHFIDYIFKLIGNWVFPDNDLQIIRKDWEFIVDKIRLGKAHELSEGDTFYLGACTKGTSAKTVRKQPFNSVLAKQRAFSLKQGYVNQIIVKLFEEQGIYIGKPLQRLVDSKQDLKRYSLDEIIVSKFEKYYNKTISDIISENRIDVNYLSKSFTAVLTKILLGIELDKEIEELTKAGVKVKTIRLGQDNVPKEHLSFPAFNFIDLVNDDWEDSAFKSQLETKFLFVFLKYNEKEELYFEKVKFWNMNAADINKCRIVWKKTQKVVLDGNIVHEVSASGRRSTNFPSTKDNSVAHVRPHATSSKDTYPLPVQDRHTGQYEYTKHSFWLNKEFIKNKIYEL